MSFAYSAALVLTNITDAAGLSSQFFYFDTFGDALVQLVTPYGTTAFNISGDTNNNFYQGIFDRTARITHPNMAAQFPTLKNPEEASYFAVCLATMPVGM